MADIVKDYIRRCGRTDPNEPLFVNNRNNSLTRFGVQYIIDKYIAEAKKRRPDLFKSNITNHSFRHSRAIHLLEAGVNLIYIRDLLGHSSIVTTEIYAKINPKIKEEQIKKHSTAWGLKSDYTEGKKSELLAFLEQL